MNITKKLMLAAGLVFQLSGNLYADNWSDAFTAFGGKGNIQPKSMSYPQAKAKANKAGNTPEALAIAAYVSDKDNSLTQRAFKDGLSLLNQVEAAVAAPSAPIVNLGSSSTPVVNSGMNPAPVKRAASLGNLPNSSTKNVANPTVIRTGFGVIGDNLASGVANLAGYNTKSHSAAGGGIYNPANDSYDYPTASVVDDSSVSAASADGQPNAPVSRKTSAAVAHAVDNSAQILSLEDQISRLNGQIDAAARPDKTVLRNQLPALYDHLRVLSPNNSLLPPV